MENKYQINSNVLEEIIKKTREDVEVKKKNVLANVIMSEMKNPVRSFVLSLSNVLRVIGDKVAIIGEIKFASPSEGFLGSPEDFIKRIKEYEKAGMDAVSIVTEKHFFKGDSSFVTKAKQISKLPILQKDFVVDEYQIYQAKKAGADAVLLIARIVSKKELVLFVKLAKGIGVEPVVEVHNNNDLAKALATKTKIIAVNARDLSTFKIDVDKACLLLKRIPDVYIRLGFSGIHSRIEVEKYKKAGANGVLIGTSLMKTKSVKEFLLGVLPSLYPASARSDFAIYEAADELRAVGSPSARSPLASTIKVKICGIRSLEAARAAVEAGADFLGFNFVPTSKRLILVNDAKEIINAVK
ncbi:MAG: hypothetical protein HYT83_03365 [Candidatus Levybacteria bacterium]|nr:hypothetical protein [Candidatus Levybacteria bacterium]